MKNETVNGTGFHGSGYIRLEYFEKMLFFLVIGKD
jgi:hypothetical protein